MNSTPLSFVADSRGSVEVIRPDDPRNIDLGATEPIDIAVAEYLPSATSSESAEL